MNCREAQERMTDLPPGASAELQRHLQACPPCSREYDELSIFVSKITPSRKIEASSHFKERVMRAIAEVEEKQSVRWFPRFALLATAAALLIVGVPVLTTMMRTPGNGAVTLLAESVQAMSGVRTVHLTGRIRTLPRDNFEFVAVDYDFVPIEMWKDFGPPQRWRVQKPGRVAVMDGSSSLLVYGEKNIVRGGTRPGFVEWLEPLLEPDTVLDTELAAVRAGKAQARMSDMQTGGARELVLAVTRKAQGDFVNDWAHNKSINESDHTCVYRFDPATKRLKALEVVIHSGRKDVVVLEIGVAVYNETFDSNLFALAIPQGVIEGVAPEQMPQGPALLPSTPRETAESFFDALAREDWKAVLTVYPASAVSDSIRSTYGGLQVVSIGAPFRSGVYGGWFVPYEVRLRSGVTKKWKVAVRNDNPAKRWLIDGGF